MRRKLGKNIEIFYNINDWRSNCNVFASVCWNVNTFQWYKCVSNIPRCNDEISNFFFLSSYSVYKTRWWTTVDHLNFELLKEALIVQCNTNVIWWRLFFYVFIKWSIIILHYCVMLIIIRTYAILKCQMNKWITIIIHLMLIAFFKRAFFRVFWL